MKEPHSFDDPEEAQAYYLYEMAHEMRLMREEMQEVRSAIYSTHR